MDDCHYRCAQGIQYVLPQIDTMHCQKWDAMENKGKSMIHVSALGMRQLCRHNFRHNRYVCESGIMLAF